ncbi:MAG: hypothetical protein KBD63_08040 [Bacteriovoracaceae bacterium]|nr:hypothetical protein [Bacteriovoracaceae bacterium]
MKESNNKNEVQERLLNIQLDTKDLSPQQIRLIKNACVVMVRTLKTGDESTFFTLSSELMHLTGCMIKQSNCAHKNSTGDQALEVAIDDLLEKLQSADVANYDN